MGLNRNKHDESHLVQDKNYDNKKNDRFPTPKWYFPRRYLLVGTGFLGLTIAYIIRVLISTAVIDMELEYGWSSSFKGVLLASFFMGYLSTQLVAQPLCDKFGGKRTLLVGLTLSIASTLFVPVAASNKAAVVIVRIITGVTQGITFPTLNWLISKWYPVSISSSLSSLTWSGVYLGTIIVDFIAPLILKNLSWEKSFYIFGGIGFLWTILWAILIKDNPKDVIMGIHPNELAFINETEEEFKAATERQSLIAPERANNSYGTIINDNNGYLTGIGSYDGADEKLVGDAAGSILLINRELDLPYYQVVKILLSSKAMLTLLYFNLVSSWGFYLLLMWYPSWLQTDPSKGGGGVPLGIEFSFFNALPYIISFFISNLTGKIADYALGKGVKKIYVRKLLGFLSSAIPGIFLFLTAFCPISSNIKIAFLTIVICSNGFSASGSQMVTLDLSPKYAGVTMGIGNFVSTIPGILGPLLAGVLLQAFNGSWLQIFSISGAFYLSGSIVWVVFASSDRVL